MSNRHSSKSHRSSSSRHSSHHASGSRQRGSDALYDLGAEATYANQSYLPPNPSTASGYSYGGEYEVSRGNPSRHSRDPTRLSGTTLAGDYNANYISQSRWSRNTSSMSGGSQASGSARSSEVPRSVYSDRPASSSSRQQRDRDSGHSVRSGRSSRNSDGNRSSMQSVSTGILGVAQAVPGMSVPATASSTYRRPDEMGFEDFAQTISSEEQHQMNSSGETARDGRQVSTQHSDRRQRYRRER